MISRLSWCEAYDTGHAAIDIAHASLFQQFSEALRSIQNLEQESELAFVIAKIIGALKLHIEIEENMIKSATWTTKFSDVHSHIHNDFISRLIQYEKSLSCRDILPSRNIVAFLAREFINHVESISNQGIRLLTAEGRVRSIRG